MKPAATKTFITNDGTQLEVLTAMPENPRACLIVWPCMGGAVQMYRVPVDSFMDQGFGCILYNPRGHGRSAGGMEIHAAMNDLDEIIQACTPAATPLVMVGHSAGANVCLQYGALHRHPERFILIAPVLDSRESLFSMYQRETISEFVDILCTYAEDGSGIRRVLSDEKWLSEDVWKANGYRNMLDALPSRMRIGEFLENLFIPGHNAFAELARFADRTRILMAEEDSWYPASTVNSLAHRHGIRVETLPEAKDHFFSGAWESAWSQILHTISGVGNTSN